MFRNESKKFEAKNSAYDEVTDISESLTESLLTVKKSPVTHLSERRKRSSSDRDRNKDFVETDLTDKQSQNSAAGMSGDDLDPNEIDDDTIVSLAGTEAVQGHLNETEESQVNPAAEGYEEEEEHDPIANSATATFLLSDSLAPIPQAEAAHHNFSHHRFLSKGPDEGEISLMEDSLGKDTQMEPLGSDEGPRSFVNNMNRKTSIGDDEEEEDEEDHMILPEGSYKSSDYETLDVSPEIKELFTFISKYTPQNIEMDHKLRPYIPDYIPAVGDIDAFIKISKPDETDSTLGLTVLDEPSAKQSDSTVLDLQLRAVAKHKTARAIIVKTVENADKNTKIIDKWMRDISDLHRARPPPTVHYTKQMPDIDSLMQEWPADVESLLKDINLPSADFDIDLQQYVDLICSALDIPIYKSRIQSLHVLFTLFSVFKNSAHFQRLVEENDMENVEQNGEVDRMVL